MRMRLFGVLAACICAVASTAQAELLINFEAPTYTTGGVSGQDGWTTISTGSAVISSTAPLAGSQSLVVGGGNGAAIYAQHTLTGGGLVDGAVVSALIEIAYPSYDSNYFQLTRSTDNGAYAGLEFNYAASGSIGARVAESSTGPVSLGNFTKGNLLNVSFTLDFTNQQYVAKVVDLTAATSITSDPLGFSTSATPTTAEAGKASFIGWSAAMKIDNLTATPEPGTLALLTSGLIGLLCYAWRKRK